MFIDKKNEIEALKAENDRLKSSGNATPTATPVKAARPPSETSSTSSSSSRQSLGLSLNNLNITDTIMSGGFSVCSASKCLCTSAEEVCSGFSEVSGEERPKTASEWFYKVKINLKPLKFHFEGLFHYLATSKTGPQNIFLHETGP